MFCINSCNIIYEKKNVLLVVVTWDALVCMRSPSGRHLEPGITSPLFPCCGGLHAHIWHSLCCLDPSSPSPSSLCSSCSSLHPTPAHRSRKILLLVKAHHRLLCRGYQIMRSTDDIFVTGFVIQCYEAKGHKFLKPLIWSHNPSAAFSCRFMSIPQLHVE